MVPGRSGSGGFKAALAALLPTAVASAGWHVTQSNAFQYQKAFLDKQVITFFSALGFAHPAQLIPKRALSAVSA